MIKENIAHNANVQSNDAVMAKLHADFPQCFNKEGLFDMENFRNLIQTKVDVTEEGYDLNFLGKNYANLIASTETETVIKPDLEHNNLPENLHSRNIYISGDNLDALKHLLKSYAEKIKCIYIDPPYNTGSDGFVYNDKFNFTADQLQVKLGISETKAKRILDLCQRGSASHSAWLTFMAPRLLLAKDLLTKDGVIFISIDDNEQANLKLLCDNVFGEENFGADIIWNSTKSVTNTALISVSHTHTIVYFIDKSYFVKNRTEFRLEDNGEGFSNPDNDPRGPWKADPFQVGGYRANQQYVITNPITGIDYKPKLGNSWKNDYAKFIELYNDNRIVFGVSGEAGPQRKRFKTEAEERGSVSKTLWTDVETTSNGTELLQKIFNGKNVFSNPKPVGLIKRILELGAKNGCYILDFFSGSGTTAHTVLSVNAEHKNSNYNFIVVQLPEDLDNSLRNANNDNRNTIQNAISICDEIGKPHTLDQIGMERIRRAANKIRAAHPDYKGDLGFKHYTLHDVPQNTLDKMESFDTSMNNAFAEEDICQSFGKETVVETWCVNDGYGFGADVRPLQLANCTAYHCGSHLYMVEGGVNFDEKAMVALIDKYGKDSAFNPQNIVLFGYSFTYTQTEMLRKNLATLKDGAKNLNINLDIRY